MVALLYDAASARPSLFAAVSTIRATIRLAKITAAFKRKLKAEVCKPGGDAFNPRTRRAFKARAYSSLDSISKSTLSRQSRLQSTLSDDASMEWFNSLLAELDQSSGAVNSSISKIAADDSLLPNHQTSFPLKTRESTSWAKAAYEYDRVTLVLLALNHRIELLNSERNACDIKSSNFTVLSDELCAANLHHILLCLQQRLFDVLLRKCLTELEEDIFEWHKYWQQQKKLSLWWFSEWPSGQRPLSTTWPWNIRPSLVILWGVCWMFFDCGSNPSGRQSDRPGKETYGGFQHFLSANDDFTDPELFSTSNNAENVRSFSGRRGSLIAAVSVPGAACADIPVRATRNCAIPVPVTEPQLPSSPPTQRNYGLEITSGLRSNNSPVLYNNIASDQPTVFESSELSRNHYYPTLDTEFASQFSGGYPFNVDTSECAFHHPQAVTNFPSVTVQAPTPPIVRSSATLSPLYISSFPQGVEGVSAFPDFDEDIMDSNSESPTLYPDPVPGSADSIRDSITPVTPIGNPYPEDGKSPTSVVSNEPKESERGTSEQPPLTCEHEDCASNPPIFRRRCEWRKHNDKHERPYICKEAGCDKLQGFTYQGGLSRHMREVHKTDGGIRERMLCPYPDCKRSTGVGFTRKENLNEHKRRVHRDSGEIKREDLDSGGARSDIDDVVNEGSRRKRKRSVVSEWSVSNGEGSGGGGDGDDLGSSKFARLETEKNEDEQENARQIRGLYHRLLRTESDLRREIAELRGLFLASRAGGG